MENSEGGPEPAPKRKNINWSVDLCRSLVEIAALAEPTRRGFHDRLELLWNQAHPTFPSRGSALARKLHRIYADQSPDPVAPESSSPGDTGPERESVSQLIALSDDLAAAFAEARSLRPASLAIRERLMAKWVRLDPETLDEMDTAMAQLWVEEGDGTLWNLNCLIYAGAGVMINRAKGANKSTQPDESDTSNPGIDADNSDSDSDGSEEGWCDLTGFESLGDPTETPGEPMDVDPANPAKPIRKRRESVREIRKSIGWIDAELSRLRGTGSKGRTRKRAFLIAKLKRIFGRARLDVKRLLALREKRVALLGVRTLQRRRASDVEAQRRANEQMATVGPQSLMQKTLTQEVPPEMVPGIESFWKGVWETEGTYHPHHEAIASWTREIREQTRSDPDDNPPLNRERAWEMATKKMKNWTAPGPDGIPGYWLKRFKRTADLMKHLLWKVLDGETEIPEWLVRGRTVLLPKEGCEGKPDQFRPITCLNCSYKLFTGVLTAILMAHVTNKNVLPEEQKALRKGRRGCLDAVAVDGMIVEETKLYSRNLSVAWIDYRKAFDLIPHGWIGKMLRAVRAPWLIRKAIKALIPKWKTNFSVKTTEGRVHIPITLRRGLFQGDSLSPLLFCLCIAPLSHALYNGTGYESRFLARPLTHLLFMDDLKVFDESQENLQKKVKAVEDTSSAVGMELGLKKCAVAHIVGGKVVQGGSHRGS